MPENDIPLSATRTIRQFLAEHPDASPMAIAEALVAQGFQVSPAEVSAVQSKLASPRPPMAEPQMPRGHISFAQGMLFYKLYAALCSYANSKLELVPGDFSDPDQFTSLPLETRVKIRDAVYAQPQLIDQFVQENPSQLTAEELAIVAGWQHAVIGKFYVFRYLQQYAVFLSTGDPVKAYGVLALATSFEELVGPYLPVIVKGVLLPINGRIIYDGLLTGYNIFFGPGIRRSLNEDYKRAKENYGIITSLPAASTPPAVRKAATKKPAASGGTADVKAVLEAIGGMTDAFCRNHLNDEYAMLCRNLAAALARKRPSPLLRGGLATWATGVVRTIGWVNFLHDPGQTPHLKLLSIDQAFGIAESTGAAKLKAIRTMFRIHQFDPKWTLPSRLEANPMVWMVSINGLIIDIRHASREQQVEAFEKGLIPYIPADRSNESDK
ncbi:conserved hypothetical protein [Candidatus Accumulibacter aalborgensis]|uniref:DUF6398 domain-containing protein n=1 Tax=Candidatus Accumulibacter aalborgensis TaxID=1860102 RepID=A0A1A8XMG5_9PROT|nr:DUF6398 domain-containing protein [Candidatus Accumulibacter aalborgensis]SBT05851.1 conserved hypothetical protein [Candidatus Accumulibacter aalborgensis]